MGLLDPPALPENVFVGAVSSAGNYTLPAGRTMFKLTLDASPTLVLPSPGPGRALTIALIQGTGGTRTVTWPASVKWQGGTAPVLSAAAGKIDIFSLVALDDVNWFGFLSGKGF